MEYILYQICRTREENDILGGIVVDTGNCSDGMYYFDEAGC